MGERTAVIVATQRRWRRTLRGGRGSGREEWSGGKVRGKKTTSREEGKLDGGHVYFLFQPPLDFDEFKVNDGLFSFFLKRCPLTARASRYTNVAPLSFPLSTTVILRESRRGPRFAPLPILNQTRSYIKRLRLRPPALIRVAIIQTVPRLASSPQTPYQGHNRLTAFLSLPVACVPRFLLINRCDWTHNHTVVYSILGLSPGICRPILNA